MVSASSIAKRSTPTLFVCARQDTDRIRTGYHGLRTKHYTTRRRGCADNFNGHGHIAMLAEKGISQLLERKTGTPT